jgi:hypothetical protein
VDKSTRSHPRKRHASASSQSTSIKRGRSSSSSCGSQPSDVEPDGDKEDNDRMPVTGRQSSSVNDIVSGTAKPTPTTVAPDKSPVGSKGKVVATCPLCQRNFTSASGWCKHRRYFRGLVTPRSVPHARKASVSTSVTKDNEPPAATATTSKAQITTTLRQSIPLGVVACKHTSFKKTTTARTPSTLAGQRPQNVPTTTVHKSVPAICHLTVYVSDTMVQPDMYDHFNS